MLAWIVKTLLFFSMPILYVFFSPLVLALDRISMNVNIVVGHKCPNIIGEGGEVPNSVKKAICSCPCSKLLWNPYQKFLTPQSKLKLTLWCTLVVLYT